MRVRKHLVTLGLSLACALSIQAGSALAAFPNFTGCPTSAPDIAGCVDIQNVSGSLSIKGFEVPLGDSLEIRGGLTSPETGLRFVPATGTNGFIARPVAVPGGLLGIDWIPGTGVQAITELAGSPSNIRIEVADLKLTVPVKMRLVNLLLGMNCHIGTDRNPVVLNLTAGTTGPPPPNRPISGRRGTIRVLAPYTIGLIENVNVDNAFAVPSATSCGLGLGLINSLVNLKLGLPSAAGNNSIQVVNNIALQEL